MPSKIDAVLEAAEKLRDHHQLRYAPNCRISDALNSAISAYRESVKDDKTDYPPGTIVFVPEDTVRQPIHGDYIIRHGGIEKLSLGPGVNVRGLVVCFKRIVIGEPFGLSKAEDATPTVEKFTEIDARQLDKRLCDIAGLLEKIEYHLRAEVGRKS